MIKVSVFYKNILAGVLEKTGDEKYLITNNPSISLTLLKENLRFESDNLFPFFDGLIPECTPLRLVEPIRPSA